MMMMMIIICCGISILFTFEISAGIYIVESDVWTVMNIKILP